jgi:Flp pilus assembly protein TadG
MGRIIGAYLRGSRKGMRGLRRDEKGVTAIEFGMVALPFFMFMFGIINTGLLYFTTFTMENATEGAARSIRTGQAKTANWTKDQFKAEVCKRTPSFVDCPGKVRVDVQIVANGTDPTPATGTSTTGSTTTMKTDAQMNYPGAFTGGDIVMVTTFYQWDLAKALPFLKFQGLTDGSKLIRASVAFKNEPF